MGKLREGTRTELKAFEGNTLWEHFGVRKTDHLTCLPRCLFIALVQLSQMYHSTHQKRTKKYFVLYIKTFRISPSFFRCRAVLLYLHFPFHSATLPWRRTPSWSYPLSSSRFPSAKFPHVRIALRKLAWKTSINFLYARPFLLRWGKQR